jgi:Ca-activated chloride channel family protein
MVTPRIPDPTATAAVLTLLTALGEWVHARRCTRLARLAWGPGAAPSPWTRMVPRLRCAAVALAAWGLATLARLPSSPSSPGHQREEEPRHVLLLLDVSPSMQLKDAGPGGTSRRMQRAAELVLSLFQSLPPDRVRFSVVAVYNGAKPVVVDTQDLDVIRNILEDLPLDLAFDPGQTRLFDGIREAGEMAKRWREASSTLLVVSDGDSVPETGMPALPRSVDHTVVVGVGDPRAGRFIDGHQSRQDQSTLRQVALRLNGQYVDGNEQPLPGSVASALSLPVQRATSADRGLREWALAAALAGVVVLSGIPLCLAWAGSRWQPAWRWDRAHEGPSASPVRSPVSSNGEAAP